MWELQDLVTNTPAPRKRPASRTQLPFQITDRDMKVLQALHRYRILERNQIQRMFFTPAHGKPTNLPWTNARLKLLYDHGFVERIQRKGWWGKPNPGPVYRLAKRGADLLAERLGGGGEGKGLNYWGRGDDKDWHPTRITSYFTEHMLLVTKLHMALETAAARSGCRVSNWLDHVDLLPTHKTERVVITLQPAGQEILVPVTPDAFLTLDRGEERAYFFLEADRGTETMYGPWQRKIKAYSVYQTSGKFNQRYQVKAGTAFRVLVVTPSIQRATHIIKAAEKYAPETARLFLAAAIPQLTPDMLIQPVWQRGGFTAPQALV